LSLFVGEANVLKYALENKEEVDGERGTQHLPDVRLYYDRPVSVIDIVVAVVVVCM